MSDSDPEPLAAPPSNLADLMTPDLVFGALYPERWETR